MSQSIYLFSTTSHPDTIHINSLDTTLFTPEINFSQYDALIITSKQVMLALTQYEKEKYINKPALCISTQTAKSFEELGGKVLKTGSGYGENLGTLITAFPKEMKWLYLRAKNVASDFVTQTKELGYKIDEVIVYETFCSENILNIEVESDAVLIFTSPSSVKCFLRNNKIKDTQKIVVIGKTTAKALPKNSNFVISDETTIDSCVKIAKTF